MSEDPAAKVISFLLYLPALISQRFIPQTSEISIGAILPREIEARNEDTREMREVFAYSLEGLVLKRSIRGPVKRCKLHVSMNVTGTETKKLDRARSMGGEFSKWPIEARNSWENPRAQEDI